MATWNLAGKARNDFADMMEALTPEQLQQQSLCAEWKARGVMAHVTGFVENGFFGIFGNLLKAGFNFDKASIAMANKQLARTDAEMLASLRSKATRSASLPTFPEGLTVADAAIHTQDVRRPLGLSGGLSPEVLTGALEFLTTHKMNKVLISELPPMDNVTLQATDMDWSWGTGPTISGPAEAIMMAIARRPVALADLSGEGLSAWK